MLSVLVFVTEGGGGGGGEKADGESRQAANPRGNPTKQDQLGDTDVLLSLLHQQW